MSRARMDQGAGQPITDKRASSPGGDQPHRPRGPIALRGPVKNASVGLRARVLPEELGVESEEFGVESVGRASDPGKNRQGDQGRYDRLHGPHSILRDPDNIIVDRNRSWGLARRANSACAAKHSWGILLSS
jgi:hypothetical protein